MARPTGLASKNYLNRVSIVNSTSFFFGNFQVDIVVSIKETFSNALNWRTAMDTLVKADDAPITVEEIKAALGIKVDTVDQVIRAGIAAHTVHMRAVTWRRTDGSTYITPGAPADVLETAKLLICRWCTMQDDIARVTPLGTHGRVNRVKTFADLIGERVTA